MQIGREYILQINTVTVGHMTFFIQSKGGAFYVQGNSMDVFLTSKV